MRLKISAVLVVLVFMSTYCYAVPAITSISLDGNELTAGGTGLAKTTPAPLSFISSEAETSGVEVTDPDYYFNIANKYHYTDGDAYSGSKSIYTNVEDWPNGAKMFYDKGAGGFTDIVYFSSMVKFKPTDTSEPWTADQIKSLTIRTDTINAGSGYGWYPQFNIDAGENLTIGNWYSVVTWNNVYGQDFDPSPCNLPGCSKPAEWDQIIIVDGYIDGPPYQPNVEEWFRAEFIGKRSSSQGADDGSWSMIIYQDGQDKIIVHERDGNANTGIDASEIWRYVGYRNEVIASAPDPGEQNIDMWIDDIYIDNSRAIVEIGDHATTPQMLVIQSTPTTRGATELIIDTVNVPESWRGTTKYLFVTDESGDRNATGESFTVPAAAPSTATTGITASGTSFE